MPRPVDAVPVSILHVVDVPTVLKPLVVGLARNLLLRDWVSTIGRSLLKLVITGLIQSVVGRRPNPLDLRRAPFRGDHLEVASEDRNRPTKPDAQRHVTRDSSHDGLLLLGENCPRRSVDESGHASNRPFHLLDSAGSSRYLGAARHCLRRKRLAMRESKG